MRPILICLASVILFSACSENSIRVANSLPTVTITSHFDGDQVVEGIPFMVRASGGDSDNAMEDLQATWTVANELVGTCNKVPVSDDGITECEVVMFMNSEPARIGVEVRDPRNGVGTNAVSLEVVPQQEGYDSPQVEIVSPADASVAAEGDPTVWEAHVSDLQDEPTTIALSWSSSLDGVFSTAGADTSGTALFVYADLQPGDHVITLTATDPEGHFTTDVITHSINALPSAPEVRISPAPPTSAEDLSVTIDTPSVDPDGGAISYTYEWLKNGVSQPYQNSALVTASDTTRGDIWTVRVHPFDGVATGPFGEDEVVVENSPPVMQTVSLGPDPLFTDSLAVAGYTAFDADGDPVNVSWDWQVNGTPQYVVGDTLDGQTHFDKGDLVQAFATANDGSDDSSPLGSTVLTVSNSPPTAPVVSIAPTAPVEQVDDLLGAIDTFSTDPDGDPISYDFAWDVDGVAYPDVGHVGPFTVSYPDDSASAADTFDGETWTLSVTAIDDALAPSVPGVDSVLVSRYVFLPDYNGLFDITPSVQYACQDNFFGITVVSFNISSFVFSEVAGTLTVSGAPTTMQQAPAPSDENFSADGYIYGGCEEHYILSGTFADNDTWSGIFQVSFTGSQCGFTTCTNQLWLVDGTRN